MITCYLSKFQQQWLFVVSGVEAWVKRRYARMRNYVQRGVWLERANVECTLRSGIAGNGRHQFLYSASMHPRNLYNKRPDFGELAEVRPSLKQFLISRSPAKRRSTSSSDTGGLNPSTFSDDLYPNNKPPLSSSPQKTKDQEDVSPSRTEPLSHSEHLGVEQEYGFTRGAEKFPYTLDFSNPEALRELTCAVLERDFGLKVELPLDRLIPAVPQRLNYVHWIEDLLMCCRQEVGGVASGGDDVIAIPKGEDIVGIDIGNYKCSRVTGLEWGM